MISLQKESFGVKKENASSLFFVCLFVCVYDSRKRKHQHFIVSNIHRDPKAGCAENVATVLSFTECISQCTIDYVLFHFADYHL